MKNTLCLFFAFSVFRLAAASSGEPEIPDLRNLPRRGGPIRIPASAGAAPLIPRGGDLLLKSAASRQTVFGGRGPSKTSPDKPGDFPPK